ncbi:beta strand repeat-containing protein [Inquilinus sp. CA228]|uniref:beta strand repeat-containing protein n=1 Tax=Inquilinus sp. CA228 TaxID=3455609 RepID=UPI003F8D5179
MAVINGNDNPNYLLGTLDDDTLNGFGGDDILDGGFGADTYSGGAGIDTILYDEGYNPDGVSVAIGGTGSFGDAEGDVIGTDVENIVGSAASDALTGSAANNALTGGFGDDRLEGLGGDDVLDGGPGGDALSGGDGNDYLNAGESFIAGFEVLEGGPGADTLIGGGSGTTITTIVYERSSAGVYVDLAALAASGGEAQGDVIGVGIQNIIGSGFDDSLYGSDERNELVGNGGRDGLRGYAGDDVLVGGDGADFLSGGTGADMLFGGGDIDTLNYSESGAGVTVNLTTVAVSGGDAEGDVIDDTFENVRGSGFADTLTGSAVANQFYAGDGNDTLSGLAGNDALDGENGDDVLDGGDGSDTLYGGAGADRLNGGASSDLVGYSFGSAGVTVNLTTLTASGGDAEGDVIGTDIEGIVGGGSDDTLTGNAANNTLYGFNGNDSLSGMAGSDSLVGHPGDDLLRGGAGGDSLEGGDGVDTATYYESASGVTVDLAAGTATGGNAEDDILTGIENLSGSNLGGDSLTGSSGANSLRGYGGNDLLRGGAGADTLEGGVGTDLASYYNSAAAVTVNLAAGTGTGGDAQGDILASIENVNGSNFADTLTGNGGANALRGLAGRDTLTGGSGADRFVYAATSESVVGANRDVVTDFSQAQADKVDLSLIDADTGTAGNQAFTFIGAGLYTGVAGQLRYSAVGGVTTIAGDVNGDGASDFHIALTGTFALLAGDFVL